MAAFFLKDDLQILIKIKWIPTLELAFQLLGIYSLKTVL